MMLAAFVLSRVVERRPAELCRPDDEHFIEQPTPFQIPEQPGNRLVDVLRQSTVVGHVAMRVPVAATGTSVDQLDEPHPALDQAASDQALPAESLTATARQPV